MIPQVSALIVAGALKAAQAAGLPWWLWALIVLVPVVLLVWLMRNQPAEPATPEAQTAAPAPSKTGGALPVKPCPAPAARPAQTSEQADAPHE